MSSYQHLRVESIGEVTAVSFRHPRIGGVLEMEMFEREVRQLIDEKQPPKLVIDFSGVQFLSSQVLSALVSLDRNVTKRQGTMRLCNIPPQVLDILAACRLDRIFDIKKDFADAAHST